MLKGEMISCLYWDKLGPQASGGSEGKVSTLHVLSAQGRWHSLSISRPVFIAPLASFTVSTVYHWQLPGDYRVFLMLFDRDSQTSVSLPPPHWVRASYRSDNRPTLRLVIKHGYSTFKFLKSTKQLSYSESWQNLDRRVSSLCVSRSLCVACLASQDSSLHYIHAPLSSSRLLTLYWVGGVGVSRRVAASWPVWIV